ncbi:hypothetical protein IWW38_005008, partial [Coemansia aciculifera]
MIYSTEGIADQNTRRVKLAESLQGRGHHLSLEELMERLGLCDHFCKYTAATADMLMTAALRVPALVNGKLLSIKDDIGDQATQATPASLAKAFRDIWDSVRHLSKTKYPVAEPTSECRFSDQRTMQIAGGASVKPDGVFYYPKYSGSEFYSMHALLETRLESCQSEMSPKVLGKMAGFAMSAWEAQPTRLFVPVFYMHGPDISLVLFARSGYYCITLGRLFHTSSDPSADDVCDIEDTLRNLWFLLTLPAGCFGHSVDVAVPTTGLKFVKSRGSLVAATTAGKGDGSALDYLQRIPQSVSLLGFQSYLFKTQYRRRPAMLKLVWTPTYRFPEAVMYDWLLSNGCEAVPEVYESAIIASNVFGYRLEYLLVEDCGVPLLEYFKADSGRCDADSERVFKQLASCLATAHHSADVIHCDISAENIAVRDGRAFIVNWTRAQLTTAE